MYLYKYDKGRRVNDTMLGADAYAKELTQTVTPGPPFRGRGVKDKQIWGYDM